MWLAMSFLVFRGFSNFKKVGLPPSSRLNSRILGIRINRTKAIQRYSDSLPVALSSLAPSACLAQHTICNDACALHLSTLWQFNETR